MRSRTLILTPGDPQGIGPEITVKALQKVGPWLKAKRIRVRVVGAALPFLENGWGSFFGDVEFVQAPLESTRKGTHLGGYQSGWSIENAARMILAGDAHALVTGPISKEHLQAGGYRYSGHTDFLADLTRSKSVTMMLANSQLRVSLATLHTGLKTVSESLTLRGLSKTLEDTILGLQRFWSIKKPKLAVLGLNPHAGESGLFGQEEKRVITPAINAAQNRWGKIAKISGPFPADTWFALNHRKPASERADAVIAMYHDQGLIPVKLLDFENTVNLSLGLPFLRTSVDHGTAFDIAGKNKADPSSMIAAIQLAGNHLLNQPSKKY